MLTPAVLARLTGVSSDTLRHYERKGLLAPKRTAAGYRLYPPESVERVRLIRRAMIIGFSLKELSKVLAERNSGGIPCQSVRALVKTRLAELETRLRELKSLKVNLRTLLHDWDKKLARTPAHKQARLLDQLGSREGFATETSRIQPRSSPITKARRSKS